MVDLPFFVLTFVVLAFFVFVFFVLVFVAPAFLVVTAEPEAQDSSEKIQGLPVSATKLSALWGASVSIFGLAVAFQLR